MARTATPMKQNRTRHSQAFKWARSFFTWPPVKNTLLFQNLI